MTISDEVQLLSLWFSPYSMRAQLALAAKDIPFTDFPQDLNNKSSLLLQSNPVHKKVPVLLHKGRAVCESVNIVEYIDEAFPSPEGNLLPEHPFDRAIARFWADFVDRMVISTLLDVVRNSGDARKASLEDLRGYLVTLEGALTTVGTEGRYFGGDNVGFVDIILGPAVVTIPAVESIVGVELIDKESRLATWIEAFQQSSIAACLPPSEKLVELARGRFPAE